MAIALAIFGVAFGAVCVWLGVRIYNRRERWAKRTAWALVAAVLMYPLSTGPAEWLLNNAAGRHAAVAGKFCMAVYRPLYRVASRCDPIYNALIWYTGLFHRKPPSPGSIRPAGTPVQESQAG